MRIPGPILSLLSVAMVGCAGGGGGAPSLAYAVPASGGATYLVGDTLTISLEALGQGMQLAARSAATYQLRYTSGSAAVRATATIQDLAADVVMPGADLITMDESGLGGDFVFELDRLGRAVSMSSPEALQLGAQVFAAPLVAHTLFPRLPGRAISDVTSWVDTLTLREETGAGVTQIASNLTYTVVGEVRADSRVLTEIAFQGTAGVTQDLALEGARINQSSQVEVVGRFRWDASAGLLYDSEMSMEGPGTIRIALLPAALPTRVRWLTRVRLQPR